MTFISCRAKVWYPYLISASDPAEAREMADQKNIPWDHCIYVPKNPGYRWDKIVGRHNLPKDNLIGSFSEEELAYLTKQEPL